MLEVFHACYKYKHLLVATTQQSIRNRFTANVLGALWLLLYPLMFLFIYSLVFIFVLGIRMPGLDSADYVLIIFSGLVPFLAFSEAFSMGTTSILANRGLLRNTLFPIEMIVARDVIVGHTTMGLGILLVWIAALHYGHIYWTHLAIPFIFFFQIIMTLGLVWITSTLTAFFRDVQQFIPIIILFLMMISPIGYTEEMVPVNVKLIVKLNPLACLMRLYRACFLEGVLPLVDLLLFGVFSMIILIIGYRFISRLKTIFSDHV